MDDNIPNLENQRRLRSVPSATPPHGTGKAFERMRPASGQQGASELLSCLILVAPSGMTEEDRANWLSAARMTLSGIPADLLAIGAKHARETCRFASEIVPAFMSVIGETWNQRKRALDDEYRAWANRNAPRIEQAEPEYITADEFREAMKGLLPGGAA